MTQQKQKPLATLHKVLEYGKNGVVTGEHFEYLGQDGYMHTASNKQVKDAKASGANLSDYYNK